MDSLRVFAGLALLVVIVPGADTILVIRTALRSGSRAGIITSLGVVTGPILWGTAAGGGVAAFATKGSWLFIALTIAGAGYLAYLAVVSFRAALSAVRLPSGMDFEENVADRTLSDGMFSLYRRGLITNLFNPKIGIFYLAIMPGLIPDGTSTLLLGFLMGSTQAFLGFVFLGGLSLLQQRARPFLAGRYSTLAFELVAGLAFAGFAFLSVASLI